MAQPVGQRIVVERLSLLILALTYRRLYVGFEAANRCWIAARGWRRAGWRRVCDSVDCREGPRRPSRFSRARGGRFLRAQRDLRLSHGALELEHLDGEEDHPTSARPRRGGEDGVSGAEHGRKGKPGAGEWDKGRLSRLGTRSASMYPLLRTVRRSCGVAPTSRSFSRRRATCMSMVRVSTPRGPRGSACQTLASSSSDKTARPVLAAR